MPGPRTRETLSAKVHLDQTCSGVEQCSAFIAVEGLGSRKNRAARSVLEVFSLAFDEIVSFSVLPRPVPRRRLYSPCTHNSTKAGVLIDTSLKAAEKLCHPCIAKARLALASWTNKFSLSGDYKTLQNDAKVMQSQTPGTKEEVAAGMYPQQS